MIEIRWVGRQLQFRQRAFQVDAAGAFCGVTDFDDWQTVPEQEIDEATLRERDDAEYAADRLSSLVLGEDIDWPCHDEAWKRAIEKLEPGVCGTCGIGFRLPSGKCDHCNSPM